MCNRTRRKPNRPLCDCPAPLQLYGKWFPHYAGNVRGCHMANDGMCHNMVPTPGCTCKACECTNAQLEAMGLASLAMHLEYSPPLHGVEYAPMDGEAAFMAWQLEQAAIYEESGFS